MEKSDFSDPQIIKILDLRNQGIQFLIFALSMGLVRGHFIN